MRELFAPRIPDGPFFPEPLRFTLGQRYRIEHSSRMERQSMHIAPLSTALGAEILGIDLAGEIPDQAAADIHAAFLAHRVLFFRDQSLSPPAFVQFARLFGEPDIYPFIKGLPETPEVIEIIKTEADTKNFGGS